MILKQGGKPAQLQTRGPLAVMLKHKIMRTLTIIGLLIISVYNSQSQNVININNPESGIFKFHENETIKKRLEMITRIDTLRNVENCYLIYKSYDLRDTIVQVLSYYQCQSNTSSGYLTRNIFNEKGSKILYEHFDMTGIPIEQYNFEYNDLGLLVMKKGFGSGEIGITIKYFYNESGTLIDKKAYRFEQEVKNYFENTRNE